jgi:hypothetical protein
VLLTPLQNSTINMKIARSSETSVIFYLTARRYIIEQHHRKVKQHTAIGRGGLEVVLHTFLISALHCGEW